MDARELALAMLLEAVEEKKSGRGMIFCFLFLQIH